MANDSFLLVIEGLDGSGKTSIGRHLAQFCETQLNKKVRLSYEPHDPSAGGLFIRQILEKKITNFTSETLMVAFAANRLDHKSRVLNDWLDRGADHMIICDRNYLSSLVYQTNDDFSKKHVMNLNQNARKPDLTIFMNVSNEVCYQRMRHRNKPQELFETDLSNTRDKYLSAIEFLKKERAEQIVTVDANGTMNEVLQDVIKVLKKFDPKYFDLEIDEVLLLGNNAVVILASETALNIPALVEDLGSLDGITDVGTREESGDGDDITVTSIPGSGDDNEDSYKVVYKVAYDDCDNACLKARFYEFNVNDNCRVTYINTYGDDAPELEDRE